MQLPNHNSRVNQCLQSFSLLPDLPKSILNVTNENTYFWKHTIFITNQIAGIDLIYIARKKITYFTSEKMDFPTEICWFVFSFSKKNKKKKLPAFSLVRLAGMALTALEISSFLLPLDLLSLPSSSMLSFMVRYNSELCHQLPDCTSLREFGIILQSGETFLHLVYTFSLLFNSRWTGKALLCSRTLTLYSCVKPVCWCSKDGKSSDGRNCLSLAPNWTNPAVEEVCILRGVSSHTKQGRRSYSSGAAFGWAL